LRLCEDLRQFLQYRFWDAVLPDLFCGFAALLVVSDPGPQGAVDHGDGDTVVQHLLAGVTEDDGGQVGQGEVFAAVCCGVHPEPVLQADGGELVFLAAGGDDQGAHDFFVRSQCHVSGSLL
jgi:hypothetical protein